MPKLKTHSGAKKRFNLTKSGKVKRAHAFKSHILTKKDTKRGRRLRTGTYADCTNEATIRKIFEDTGYLIDTHTGVAATVYNAYKAETGDQTKTVIASTASPYKFSHSVLEAIKGKSAVEGKDEFAVVDELSEVSGTQVPKAVEELRSAVIRHNTECDVDKMGETVKNILGIA